MPCGRPHRAEFNAAIKFCLCLGFHREPFDELAQDASELCQVTKQKKVWNTAIECRFRETFSWLLLFPPIGSAVRAGTDS